MKKEALEIRPEFIIDETGKKTKVLLDISTFEELLEKLEDLYLGSIAKQALKEKDQFVSFKEAKKRLDHISSK